MIQEIDVQSLNFLECLSEAQNGTIQRKLDGTVYSALACCMLRCFANDGEMKCNDGPHNSGVKRAGPSVVWPAGRPMEPKPEGPATAIEWSEPADGIERATGSMR